MSTLGSDFSAVEDFDENWTFLETDKEQRTALVQAIARRIINPRGGNPWDPQYATDIKQYVADSETPERAADALAAEVLKDERVQSSAVRIDSSVKNRWIVYVSFVSNENITYDFTLSVTDVTVEILNGV